MLGTDVQLVHPEIVMEDPADMPKGMKDQETHDALLKYLIQRVERGRSVRDERIIRYARIDKAVSAWKKLDEEDQKREQKEDQTGIPQAITTVIPIIHAHLEDMTAFYAGVFSPNAHDFYALPQPESSEQLTALVEKMNADAKYCGYYTQLTSMLRTILKYNIAGFHIHWKETKEPNDTTMSGNHIESLDMYNTFWDSVVVSPSAVSTDAEWAAEVRIKNRYWIVKQARINGWWRIEDVLESDNSEIPTNGRKAEFYRFPPQDSGMAAGTVGSEQLLDQYFAGLENKTPPQIQGHEVMRVYCRLNPNEWDLLDKAGQDEHKVAPMPEYTLWEFTIINSTQIVHAQRVETATEHIPYYMGHLNVDELGEASKSIAELLKSFQGFISFLFNIHIQGARQSTWGFIGINPKFYDATKIKAGDVAGVLQMRDEVAQSHINPSLGFAKLDNNTRETRQTMTDVSAVMQLLQLLFPSQNLPSQVASIDRAVESQVAAVVQGVSRRLHMLANTLDSQIAHPMRMAAYWNIGLKGNDKVKSSLNGLDYDAVVGALGSGLKQLNREAAAKAMERVLFALIQSPQTLQEHGIDVLAMMDYWADLLELDIDLTQFQKKVEPAEGSANGESQTAGASANPVVAQQGAV